MTPATVAAYDAGTRSGRLLRDDGTALVFEASALDPRVLLLRPGQRVHVREQDGAVVAVEVAGLPR